MQSKFAREVNTGKNVRPYDEVICILIISLQYY